jgi:ATP adenylyltransferase/5',5'''-P-1,P-4-tetraphosphate phosphorylase II
LASKPGTIGASENDAFKNAPKYGPGSDLADFDPKLTVSKIHDTHVLVLNRFAVYRPQYLIITLDSFRRQTENLDKTDLATAWTVLQGLPDEHFIMFNCGSEAGCSRLHKHLQVIPCSEDFPLFPDQDELDPSEVPFQYFIHRVDSTKEETAEDMLATYEDLRQQAFQAWQSAMGTTKDYFPHNMMLTKRWMMVVPRRRSAFQGASANAAGMMGLVWVTSQDQADKWTEARPTKVLEELGVPSRPGETVGHSSLL